jgi:3-deoxy-7-phosphoheptulonate synthase
LGAIGAHTTESQVHREVVSGLSCPVGFKNGTSGDVQIAIEAVRSAAHPHTFLGHTKNGQSAIFVTVGNPDCHVILRGGRTTTNYDAESVGEACFSLKKASLPPRVMVDCSHANSRKDYTKQPAVCRTVVEPMVTGSPNIMGVMLESNLVAGGQRLTDRKQLAYGQSITDPCTGWDETLVLLGELAAAVRSSRRCKAILS